MSHRPVQDILLYFWVALSRARVCWQHQKQKQSICRRASCCCHWYCYVIQYIPRTDDLHHSSSSVTLCYRRRCIFHQYFTIIIPQSTTMIKNKSTSKQNKQQQPIQQQSHTQTNNNNKNKLKFSNQSLYLDCNVTLTNAVVCKRQAMVYDILPWRKVPESDARVV